MNSEQLTMRNKAININCSLFFVHCSLLFVLCSLFFLACNTAPQSPEPFSAQFGNIPLEPGARAYALVDVKASRPILDLIPLPGVTQKQAAQIFDVTNSLAAALYPAGNEYRFQISAWGQFSSSQGDMMFGSNKEWKKARCDLGHTFWYSSANNLSAALGNRQAFIAQPSSVQLSSKLLLAPCTHSQGTDFPEAYRKFSQGSVFYIWMVNPGSSIDNFFERISLPLKLPAENIFISLFQSGDKSQNRYEAVLRIETPGESQARTLARIISMAGLFSGGISGTGVAGTLMEILFANVPEQVDNFIVIKSPPLSAPDLALLINSFFIY